MSQSETLIGRTIKFSSIYIPLLATVAYTIGGLLASFNIQWNDPQLPRLSWTQEDPAANGSDNTKAEAIGTNNTQSAFVAIAKGINTPLANCINAFLIFTALTCASTNLYVASRSLFALTSRLDDSPSQPWYLRVFAYFGKTNKRKVPMRAMVLSALAFCWIPFLHLVDSTGIGKVRRHRRHPSGNEDARIDSSLVQISLSRY